MPIINKTKRTAAIYNRGREVVKVYDHGTLAWQKQSSIPDYLCFTALEAGTFTLTIPAAVTPTYLSYVEWSKNGRTWNHTDNTSEAVTIDVQVAQGEKVYWRGSGNVTSTNYTSGNYSFFSSSKSGGGKMQFDVSGNFMSLLVLDSFSDSMSWNYNTRTFCALFEYTAIRYAKDMIIPLNYIGYYAAIYMFRGSSMESAPTMHPTRLGCNALNSTFASCKSLTDVSGIDLSGVTTFDVYSGSGRNCYSMFSNCTALITAPLLPTIAPVVDTYQTMFSNCSSLSYVKCLATDISANGCLTNWLYNVSSTGTFIQAEGVTWPRGASGIPTGWLTYDEGEDIPNDYTPCDYIYNSSTGSTGAVDLGFVFSTKNNSLEVKFKQDEISNGMPCGSREGAGAIWLYNYEAENRFAIIIKSVAVAKIVLYVYDPLDTDTHIVKYVGDGDDQYYYHNGELKAHGTRTDLSDTCPYNFYIFGRPTNGYKGRIYYQKVWNTATGEFISNLKSCSRNSDGAAGFWDTAQKKFFTKTYWTAHFDNE